MIGVHFACLYFTEADPHGTSGRFALLEYSRCRYPGREKIRVPPAPVRGRDGSYRWRNTLRRISPTGSGKRDVLNGSRSIAAAKDLPAGTART